MYNQPKHMTNIHEQRKLQHKRTPRPAPRSGRRVSLKREGPLA